MTAFNLPPGTLLSAKELASLLRMHEATIRKYAARGDIPNVRIGKVFRFEIQAIEAWLQARVTGTSDAP